MYGKPLEQAFDSAKWDAIERGDHKAAELYDYAAELVSVQDALDTANEEFDALQKDRDWLAACLSDLILAIEEEGLEARDCREQFKQALRCAKQAVET